MINKRRIIYNVKKNLKKFAIPLTAGALVLPMGENVIRTIQENKRIEKDVDELMENNYLELAKAIYSEEFNEKYGESVLINDISFDISYGNTDSFELRKEREGDFIFLRKIHLDEVDEFHEGSGCVLTVSLYSSDEFYDMKTARNNGDIYCVFYKSEEVDPNQSQMSFLHNITANLITAEQHNSFHIGKTAIEKSKKYLKELIKDGTIDKNKIQNLINNNKYRPRDDDEYDNYIISDDDEDEYEDEYDDKNYELQNYKQSIKVDNTIQAKTMEYYIDLTTGDRAAIEKNDLDKESEKDDDNYR